MSTPSQTNVLEIGPEPTVHFSRQASHDAGVRTPSSSSQVGEVRSVLKARNGRKARLAAVDGHEESCLLEMGDESA